MDRAGARGEAVPRGEGQDERVPGEEQGRQVSGEVGVPHDGEVELVGAQRAELCLGTQRPGSHHEAGPAGAQQRDGAAQQVAAGVGV